MIASAGLWLKVEASRRQNDPRKRSKISVSTVRLRCQSGRRMTPRGPVVGSKRLGANVPAGECGVKDQVSREAQSIFIYFGGILSMFEDKTLICKDCGKEFVFTAGEQAFYAEKGFQNEPTRCKACRTNRKNAARGEREMFETVCAECGKPTRVPFIPKSDRPIYCSECFAAKRQQF